MSLIDSSAIIFEGKIAAVDTVPGDQYQEDVLVKFEISKVYKGEKLKKVVIRSSNGSCGFTTLRRKERDIGRHCLVYSTKEEGYYSYVTCSNRIVSRETYYGGFDSEELRKKQKEAKKDYESEIRQLDSLLSLKK